MKTNDVLVERTMPKDGQIVSDAGEVVEPFTKLGVTKVSYGRLPLSKGLKLAKGKHPGNYLYTGDLIGRLGRKKIIAPFDGTLLKLSDKSYVYQQEDKDFWLLAGVWGSVESVAEKKSVLIKTQMVDIHLAVSTGPSCSGELIVFPNPTELLEMQYLRKFSKDSFGKVVYVGNHINTKIVVEANKLGVVGLIAGSCDRQAYTYAKQNGMFVGGICGFGHIPTPGYIFDVLKEVSSRYVFLQEDKSLLRIPSQEPFESTEIRKSAYSGQLRSVQKGLLVQIFEEPYFGWVGRVHSEGYNEVQVIVDEGRDPVKIKVPNVISLE